MSEFTMTVRNSLISSSLSGVAFKDYSRRKRIIGHLSVQSAATLTELAELINLSIPKTTELIAGMEQEGLVISSGRRSEGPGRKASIYSLSTNAFYFLGLEIKKYSVNIGLMGFDKQLLFVEDNISFLAEDPEVALTEIVTIIQRFIEQCGVPTTRLAGIGCSISGRVNMHTGDIMTIYHFGNAPVKQFLEKSLGIPVFLDNDSRALSYGEFHFGKRTSEKEVLVINLDYGVAIGIFIGGKPVYGASGYAGEVGHIPLFDNDKICFCGKKGCLETEASGRALIETLEKEMQEGSNSLLMPVFKEKGRIELQDVVQAIHKGDNLSLEAISTIAAKLGRGLAVVINIFNPQLIIVGGTLSAVGDGLLLPIKEHILRHSLTLVSSDTNVVLSELGPKAGILGCCLLVRDKIFELV